MPFRRILPILLLAALLVPAAGASAKSRYKVGIGEQSASMFSDPNYQSLGLKRVRYIVPWDWRKHDYQRAEIDAYMAAARTAGRAHEVFVHFSASRGCWNGRYSKAKRCRAPSVRAFKRQFKAFRRAYPFVKVFGTWNEANHASQPTYKSPRKAAKYYNAIDKACRRCKIVAADLLDSSNLIRYTKKFRKHARGNPKLWGLHNYSDVNRKRSRITKSFLRTVRGQVWLTETGGIVSFGRNFRYSPTRAKNRLSYMFRLADRFSRKRRGLKSRITRIYPYEWIVESSSERFDAALVNSQGTPRKAYGTFKKKVRTRSK